MRFLLLLLHHCLIPFNTHYLSSLLSLLLPLLLLLFIVSLSLLLQFLLHHSLLLQSLLLYKYYYNHYYWYQNNCFYYFYCFYYIIITIITLLLPSQCHLLFWNAEDKLNWNYPTYKIGALNNITDCWCLNPICKAKWLLAHTKHKKMEAKHNLSTGVTGFRNLEFFWAIFGLITSNTYWNNYGDNLTYLFIK